jgi:hypothetical protein
MHARSPVRSPTNVVLRRCTHTTFHSTETPQTSSQGFAQDHRWRCCYTFERPTTRLSFHSASCSTLQHTPCQSSFIPSLFGIVGHVRLTTTSTLGTTPASVGLVYCSVCFGVFPHNFSFLSTRLCWIRLRTRLHQRFII